MIVAPKFKIYYKPLLPKGGGGLTQFDPKVVMRKLQRQILKKAREEIQAGPFSPRAKRALKAAMSTKMNGSSITVTAKHPAFFPLLQGRKNRQMTWLVKAKAPIPIITENGELIFRSATPRSMERGRWYHPGSKPTTVLEKAKSAARKVIKENLAKDLKAQIRQAFLKVK